MKTLGILLLSSLVFLTPVVCHAADDGQEKIQAYYFHTSARCQSCMAIEAQTEKALEAAFADEMAEGDLMWKTVNIDKAENKDYIQRYSLYTNSVVLSKQADGEEVAWVNLDKVWQLVRNKEAFETYIQDETDEFIESSE